MVYRALSKARIIMNNITLSALSVTLILTTGGVVAQSSMDHSHSHAPGGHAMPAPVASQARVPVDFPAKLKEHTLSNMRDHLLAISEIQHHLGQGHFEIAGKIAEQRLGMSSLALHGAHESAKYMPKGMQELGTAMHRSASQFYVVAQETEVTRDFQKTLTALAKVTATCVACHASYQFK